MTDTPTTEPIVDLLDAEWRSLVELGATFSTSDWETPTELPGWTVKDCYSHVVGIERSLQGVEAPPIDLADFPHLTALSAAATEPAVQARRGSPGPEVLDELRTVAAERLDALRALSPTEWEAVGPTPIGERSYREFMHVRLFDCWMHEQDVRRVVGRPGHQDGPVAEHGLGRCAQALGFVVAKKAAAPDGAVVDVVLSGPLARTLTVVVEGGRGRAVVRDGGAELPDPTVSLGMDQETLWCLNGGRWDPEAVLAEGRVTISGDRPLGEAVVRSLNVMI